MNHGQFDNREIMNVSATIDGLKQNYSALWNLYSPRRYRNVERYQDHRMVNTILCTVSAYISSGMTQTEVGNEPSQFGVISSIGAKYSFPLFFVAPEMFLAASQTTPPDEIDWETMHLPFDFMTFVLPKRIARIGDHEVTAIQLTRAFKGIHTIPGTGKVMILTNNILYIDVFDTTGMRFMRHFIRPYKPGDADAWDMPENNSLYTAEMDGIESEMTDVLVRTAFNLIYALAARPELLTKGTRSGTHKKSKQEIWSPNIIGEHYKISRPGADLGGTHASPRMHWRRGHFRNQVFGEGRAKTKIIWLEPCLVGAKEKAA